MDKQLAVGDKVNGVYYGVEYSGVVTSQRLHTMNHNTEIFDVDLDNPIVVFGLSRDAMIISIPNNGVTIYKTDAK